MYQGQRWNDHPLYHSPMIQINGLSVFVGDLVAVRVGSDVLYGKIIKFYKEVCHNFFCTCARKSFPIPLGILKVYQGNHSIYHSSATSFVS